MGKLREGGDSRAKRKREGGGVVWDHRARQHCGRSKGNSLKKLVSRKSGWRGVCSPCPSWGPVGSRKPETGFVGGGRETRIREVGNWEGGKGRAQEEIGAKGGERGDWGQSYAKVVATCVGKKTRNANLGRRNKGK